MLIYHLGDNAESQSVESASLLIAFDDGDHAEVPIHRIRMLPDHFANLTELNDTNTVVGRGVAPASPSSPSSAPGRSRCPSSSALVNKPKVENAQNRRMSESNVGRKRRVSAASVEKRDSGECSTTLGGLSLAEELIRVLPKK